MYSTKKEWSDTIRLLGFIAKYDEINILKKLKTPKDWRDGVYNFWKKRDRGENVYVAKAFFYKRVQLVNTKYGKGHNGQGWKTDRGRIYIKFGRPDYVNYKPMNRNYNIYRAKPYEVWTYEQMDRIFIFVDTSRTGIDYRLVLISNRRGENLGLSEEIYSKK